MSETKFYVIENTESLWYKAKSTECIYFWISATKHVWICECSKYTGDRQHQMVKIRDVNFGYFS